jgi:hypothetical protein
VLGKDRVTGGSVIALTEQQENTIEYQESWTCKVQHAIPVRKEAAFLGTVTDILLAAFLVNKTPPKSILFVHKAGPVLRNVIWSWALGKNVNPFFTTSTPTSKTQNTIFIHPRVLTQGLKELLPRNIAVAASFDGSATNGVFSRAKALLPLPIHVESLETFYQSWPLLPGCHKIEVRDLLHSSYIIVT